MPSSSLALVFLGLTALCWLLLPLAALFGQRHTNSRGWSWIVAVGAVTLLTASVFLFTSSQTTTAVPYLYLGTIPVAFHLDRLAAWFLGIIAVVSLAIAPYLPGYMDHLKKRVDMRLFWMGLSWLLFSMAVVALAANVQTFLVAWELMSLTSFVLVATDHEPHATRQAALIYLGATRVGTALLAGGFLWAHALTASWWFADWHLHGTSSLGPGLLILAGLGVKAGMWPFHLWLPIAHPAAPSPVSALMSGVMVKIAIAVMVRFFVIAPTFGHPAFGYALLCLGAVSAFWGVLFALLQHDLKRLLAYHTVENIGLILMGMGVCLLAGRLGLPLVAEIAVAAALFHTANHAIFKSLLFLSAGAVDTGAGSRELGLLGGLGRRMPWTFAFFVLGAAAICALPPFNGFASEWLLYQSFLRLATGAAVPLLRFVGLLLIGWVGLVGALAVACFIKAAGVVFEGRPRSGGAEHAHEASLGMRVGQAMLGACCVALGLVVPLVLRSIAVVVAPLGPVHSALSAAWTVPIVPLVIILAFTLIVGFAWMDRARRRQPVRSYITWECGFGDLGPRSQVTATSFAQPILRMFGVIFRYTEHLQIEGKNRRLFPERLTATASTESLLEKRVYSPAARWVWRAGALVLWIQAGSIHRYLLTMFLALLVLLAIGGYSR